MTTLLALLLLPPAGILYNDSTKRPVKTAVSIQARGLYRCPPTSDQVHRSANEDNRRSSSNNNNNDYIY